MNLIYLSAVWISMQHLMFIYRETQENFIELLSMWKKCLECRLEVSLLPNTLKLICIYEEDGNMLTFKWRVNSIKCSFTEVHKESRYITIYWRRGGGGDDLQRILIFHFYSIMKFIYITEVKRIGGFAQITELRYMSSYGEKSLNMSIGILEFIRLQNLLWLVTAGCMFSDVICILKF